jgi:hypothetical protein
MNERECSDIEIVQHWERERRCLWPAIKIVCKPITSIGCVSSVLKTEWSNISVANVSDQSARKYNEKFSTEIEDQGSLYLVLKSSNTEYCFFTSSHCSVLSTCFETRVS